MDNQQTNQHDVGREPVLRFWREQKNRDLREEASTNEKTDETSETPHVVN